MNAPTETIRRAETAAINSNPGSREYLEAKYGEVWNTSELQQEFTVLSFMVGVVWLGASRTTPLFNTV